MKRSIAFGTDGIRGNAEQYPFTQDALFILGQAIAQWAQEKYAPKTPKFLIGRDTRLSGPRIKEALIAGLGTNELIIVDGGILPTPAVCALIRHENSFDCGIVISASHNPYYDNGIKIFDKQTSKLLPHDEATILKYFEHYTSNKKESTEVKATLATWEHATQTYINILQARVPKGMLNDLTIVLDCANGATAHIAPQLFQALGATVISLNATPTGTNINDNCGSLHPALLRATAQKLQAHAGFAFDGDGDRITMVNTRGDIKDGDDALALLLQLPEFSDTGTIIGTIMSNKGFEAHLKQHHKELMRTPVGDKYVALALEENFLPLGGEISGHIIIKNYLPTSDGIFVALKILESLIHNQNWDMKTFDKFPQVLISVPVTYKKELSTEPYLSIIKKHEHDLDNGRLLVRYSGTENVLRVMTEAQTEQNAQSVAQKLATQLQTLLSY